MSRTAITALMMVALLFPAAASAGTRRKRNESRTWEHHLLRIVDQARRVLKDLDGEAKRTSAANRTRRRLRTSPALERVHRLFADLDLDPRHITRFKVRDRRPGSRQQVGCRIEDSARSPTLINDSAGPVTAASWERLEVSADGRLLITTMIQPEDRPAGPSGQRVVTLDQARRAFPRADIRRRVRDAFTD